MSIAKAKIKIRVRQSHDAPNVWGVAISATSQGFVLPEGIGQFVPFGSREEAEDWAKEVSQKTAHALSTVILNSGEGSVKMTIGCP